MEIHLVSSLKADDERRLAPSVLEAIEGLLDGLTVSYAVRIKTHLGSPIYRSHEISHSDDANGPPEEFTTPGSPC
jgi:hypothetical protein